MKTKMDLCGRRFGMLVAIRPIGKRKNRSSMVWLCKCDCGNEKGICRRDLLQGSTISCGCYSREESRKRLTKHGKYGTRIHYIWASMVQRCCDSSNTSYKRYGAIGIRVCEEWKDFNKFYEWAMQNGYSDDLSIDRINNKDGYYPQNCRWVTAKVQANNRTTNLIFELNGEKLTLAQISEKYGINYQCLHKRIKKYKWNIEKAVTVPVNFQKMKDYS